MVTIAVQYFLVYDDNGNVLVHHNGGPTFDLNWLLLVKRCIDALLMNNNATTTKSL